MIAVTGATGQLGRFVVSSLLDRVPAEQIVAVVRTPSKAADFAQRGVQVREADYNRPATLAKAFAGVDTLLLISSTSIGLRVAEHKAVVDAAKAAGVKLLAYTSVINADTSTLIVTPDHKATEEYIIASGIPYVFLRNGWYLENHLAALGNAIQQGAVLGSAGDGKISAAARKDYGDAAAAVLATPGHENKVYELGGDSSFTLSDLAAEASKYAGKTVVFKNLPEQEYEAILKSFGLPGPIAHLLADSDEKVSHGEMYTESKDLSSLLGRPTTTMQQAVAATLAR